MLVVRVLPAWEGLSRALADFLLIRPSRPSWEGVAVREVILRKVIASSTSPS